MSPLGSTSLPLGGCSESRNAHADAMVWQWLDALYPDLDGAQRRHGCPTPPDQETCYDDGSSSLQRNPPRNLPHLAARLQIHEVAAEIPRHGSPSKRRRAEEEQIEEGHGRSDGTTAAQEDGTPRPAVHALPRDTPGWTVQEGYDPFTMPPPPLFAGMHVHAHMSSTADHPFRIPLLPPPQQSSASHDSARMVTTPSLSYSSGLPQRFLRSEGTATGKSGSAGTSTTSTSRRSKSPVKKVTDLLLFSKPVEYGDLEDMPRLKWIEGLADAVASTDFSQGIFPFAIKDQIIALMPRKRPPESSFTQDETHANTEQVQRTHEQLMLIRHTTRASAYWNRSESAWNLLVHWPMLSIALSSIDGVIPELITTAQILRPFLPALGLTDAYADNAQATTSGSSPSPGKMVDLALLCQPSDSDSPLSTVLASLLTDPRLPPDQKTPNQSDYGPLRIFPAPVPIETKASSRNLEEAKVQLGVWLAAWFKRMRVLLYERGDHVLAAHAAEIIPVPALAVLGERWVLYYAFDYKGAIRIYGPEDIGDTRTVPGIYRLLACLKAIGKWVVEDFQTWFLENV